MLVAPCLDLKKIKCLQMTSDHFCGQVGLHLVIQVLALRREGHLRNHWSLSSSASDTLFEGKEPVSPVDPEDVHAK